MPIDIKMPALSPTMEEGTLARWLVKAGDRIGPGDIIAEIETDKATMEFETIDEGVVASIAVEGGAENVKVGTIIATLAQEGEDPEAVAAASRNSAPDASGTKADEPDANHSKNKAEPSPGRDAAQIELQDRQEKVAGEQNRTREQTPPSSAQEQPSRTGSSGERIVASPLARRIAADRGIDLAAVAGTGPHGRIVKADIENARTASAARPQDQAAAAGQAERESPSAQDFGIPHEARKLSMMRKTIARRLTESKQQVPHIYLTVDARLDAMLKLRREMNDALAAQGIKLSINDLMIKALARSLEIVPKCNVQYTGDQLLMFSRVDVSVAVSIPDGLITPIIKDAAAKSISKISAEITDLAARARDGKLQPEEYQGGTASLTNMGMYGIKQFSAVINPPQAMIMAIGAGQKRPFVVDDTLQIASVMSVTGSFDHRAIDGADGAELMAAFKQLIENPLALLT
ncbi:pyruvate dehydrogenase complex dihydrolipoamide acetyltransferase [Croceicoccus sp. F390]|uniref:Acetyltransferase component of pyruvate dehydrogenase complex n=1 Tax=Croceicoccus esteveae TaxID=3075597 RepID=A0ABU2ZG11_9SPHN|nr:pyruvate dehydrogenase complex dihydrolipoamide acetyltransferase [Croceicoccus sp. F390]MDT0575527.1 pyruvate dehydrogenase complex dihydrolipoamide acetyltransferase [Croceicoccus sp. F390]